MRTPKLLPLAAALLALAALPVAAQAQRGMIGITFSPVDTLGTQGGPAVVEAVLPGSPAARAGVVRGDTIVQWNGRRRVMDAIRAGRLAPGDTVRLHLRRGRGHERTVPVVAADRLRMPRGVRIYSDNDTVIVIRPGEIEARIRINTENLAARMDSLSRRLRVIMADSVRVRMDSLQQHLRVIFADSVAPQLREAQRALARARVEMLSAPGEVSVVTLGMRGVAGAEFAEVDSSLGSYFGTDYGALVLRAAPDAPAARSGLRPGDVVVEADGRPVRSVHDLRAAVLAAQRADRESVQLQIIRKHDRQTVTLKWE